MFASVENVNITENETIIVEDWDYLVNAAKLYAEYAKTKKKFEFFIYLFCSY